MSKPLSRDAVKLAAMATMACNHFALALMPYATLWREVLVDIGCFTAVTMCYFLVEGYRYTRSRKAYALRLLGFGVVAQPIYLAALGVNQLNMLFTLFFCFLLIWAMDAFAGRWYRYPVAAALVLVTAWCDWPVLAAGFTLLFVVCGPLGRRWTGACFVMAAALFFAFNYTNYAAVGWEPAAAACHAGWSCVGILAAGAVILFLYNGKRSAFGLRHPRLSKYFFYAFYPGHLALLAVARLVLMH